MFIKSVLRVWQLSFCNGRVQSCSEHNGDRLRGWEGLCQIGSQGEGCGTGVINDLLNEFFYILKACGGGERDWKAQSEGISPLHFKKFIWDSLLARLGYTEHRNTQLGHFYFRRNREQRCKIDVMFFFFSVGVLILDEEKFPTKLKSFMQRYVIAKTLFSKFGFLTRFGYSEFGC